MALCKDCRFLREEKIACCATKACPDIDKKKRFRLKKDHFGKFEFSVSDLLQRDKMKKK